MDSALAVVNGPAAGTANVATSAGPAATSAFLDGAPDYELVGFVSHMGSNLGCVAHWRLRNLTDDGRRRPAIESCGKHRHVRLSRRLRFVVLLVLREVTWRSPRLADLSLLMMSSVPLALRYSMLCTPGDAKPYAALDTWACVRHVEHPLPA